MIDNPELSMATIEAAGACAHEIELLARVRTAMRAMRGHNLLTDPAQQMFAAIMGARLKSPREQQKRIDRTLDHMQEVGSLVRGGLRSMAEELNANRPDDYIDFRKMWDNIQQEKN